MTTNKKSPEKTLHAAFSIPNLQRISFFASTSVKKALELATVSSQWRETMIEFKTAQIAVRRLSDKHFASEDSHHVPSPIFHKVQFLLTSSREFVDREGDCLLYSWFLDEVMEDANLRDALDFTRLDKRTFFSWFFLDDFYYSLKYLLDFVVRSQDEKWTQSHYQNDEDFARGIRMFGHRLQCLFDYSIVPTEATIGLVEYECTELIGARESIRKYPPWICEKSARLLFDTFLKFEELEQQHESKEEVKSEKNPENKQPLGYKIVRFITDVVADVRFDGAQPTFFSVTVDGEPNIPIFTMCSQLLETYNLELWREHIQSKIYGPPRSSTSLLQSFLCQFGSCQDSVVDSENDSYHYFQIIEPNKIKRRYNDLEELVEPEMFKALNVLLSQLKEENLLKEALTYVNAEDRNVYHYIAYCRDPRVAKIFVDLVMEFDIAEEVLLRQSKEGGSPLCLALKNRPASSTKRLYLHLLACFRNFTPRLREEFHEIKMIMMSVDDEESEEQEGDDDDDGAEAVRNTRGNLEFVSQGAKRCWEQGVAVFEEDFGEPPLWKK